MTNPITSAGRGAEPALTRPRVLVLLPDPAALREPAIRNEVASLGIDYEIGILTVCSAAVQDKAAQALERERMLAEITAFRPDVLHAHGLGALGQVGLLAEAAGLPFTLRAHARDSAPLRPRRIGERMMQLLRRTPSRARSGWLADAQRAAASELCLGILALPFARPWLARAGLAEAKIIDCFPAANVAGVHDRSPNGDGVMSIAPAPPRRRAVPDILRLAAKVPGRAFTLYAPYEAAAPLGERNEALGTGVTILPPLDPANAAAEYKRHRWLVLTADTDTGLADWPLAVAEAQAAGVGVCMPALRPDLVRYVGKGAGILYETIDELPAIVSGPLPDEMRERGFAQAAKSDIARHRHLLTDLWDHALRRRPVRPRARAEAAAATALPPAAGAASDMSSAA